MLRLFAISPCALLATGLLCLLALLSPYAAAAQADLNDLIQSDGDQTTAGDIAAPDQDADPEQWLLRSDVLENLVILVARPVMAESCQDLLMGNRDPVVSPYQAAANEVLEFDLADLCFLGFRNNSGDRTLLIKVSDEFQSISMTTDSRLKSGLALSPLAEIFVPIRAGDIPEMTFEVQTIWMDERHEEESIDPTAFEIHVQREQPF